MQLCSLIHTIKSNFKFPGVDNLVLNKNKVIYQGLVFQYTLYFTLPWVKHNAQAFKFLYNMKISKGILFWGGHPVLERLRFDFHCTCTTPVRGSDSQIYRPVYICNFYCNFPLRLNFRCPLFFRLHFLEHCTIS